MRNPNSHSSLSLFDARLVWVEERAGLDVLGHEFGADAGDLVPVVEHGEGQVLLGHCNYYSLIRIIVIKACYS